LCHGLPTHGDTSSFQKFEDAGLAEAVSSHELSRLRTRVVFSNELVDVLSTEAAFDIADEDRHGRKCRGLPLLLGSSQEMK
jgi:hypothetical protein